jgi:hypothetical protein
MLEADGNEPLALLLLLVLAVIALLLVTSWL